MHSEKDFGWPVNPMSSSLAGPLFDAGGLSDHKALRPAPASGPTARLDHMSWEPWASLWPGGETCSKWQWFDDFNSLSS